MTVNNAPITGTIVPFCYRGGIMKDMSVEELLNHLGDIAFYGDAEHWNKAAHELLRRYEELDKQAINWAKIAGGHQKQTIKLVDEIESLRCCGNCYYGSPFSSGCNKQQHGKYCNRWQSDGLARAEREGK